MTRPRILVVGGGIAGLSAAWEASRGGVPVALVEAGPRFGGKIRTERAGDLLVEHGPDSFVTYQPAAIDLVREVGLGDQLIPVTEPRTVHIRVDGHLRPMPDGMGTVLPTRLAPFVTTRVLTTTQKLRAAWDVALPRRLPDGDVSIGELLRARLGDGVVDRLANPLVGGIYGTSVDSLSLDAVLPTLRTSERDHRSLLLASLAQGRARRRAHPGDPTSPFRSLVDGLGSLVEQVRDALVTSGADLRTRTRVGALTPVPGGTRATFDDGSELQVEAVILAVGPPALASLLAPNARAAANAVRCIPCATTAVVTLAFSGESLDELPTGHGWLEADHAPISAATITSNKWAGRAPADTVLIRAFVPDRLGPLARGSDGALWRTVSAHVQSVLRIHGEPLLARTARWEDTMPTYTVGHLRRVRAAEQALVELPGWFAAGSALHGVGIPDCIADGRQAARSAVGWLAGAAGGPDRHRLADGP